MTRPLPESLHAGSVVLGNARECARRGWKASNGLQRLFPTGSVHTTAGKSVISAMASRGITRVRSMPQMMTEPLRVSAPIR